MSNSKLVYSTSGGRQDQHKNEDLAGKWQVLSGPTKMRLETASRGGKSVTVLFNLPLTEDEAKALLKVMQSQFGCGGTLKTNSLELRGDVRNKVEVFFAQKNMKIIRAGG
jgi:translation initiation factor 1 (eIF-1/SUI1)